MFDNDFNTQEEIQEEVIDKSKRTRCTRRKRDAAKALRKQRISRQIYRSTGHEYYRNLHQYSKNKIHCSCPLCAAKTTMRGRTNFKISDLRQRAKMQEQVMEFRDGDF